MVSIRQYSLVMLDFMKKSPFLSQVWSVPLAVARSQHPLWSIISEYCIVCAAIQMYLPCNGRVQNAPKMENNDSGVTIR